MSQPAFSPKEYDQKIQSVLPYYQEFYRQVVDTVKVLDYPSLSWLDLGCGTGKMGEAAFSAFAPKRFVFWDQSPEMIAIAKSRFADANAEFVTASLLDLHCREEFNVITAIEVNHYLSPEERRKAIANVYQALQPGGVFFTFENFAPNSRTGQQLALKRWGAYQVAQGRSAQQVKGHLARYDKDYFPISLSAHLQLLQDCGFPTAELLWLSYLQVGLFGIK